MALSITSPLPLGKAKPSALFPKKNTWPTPKTSGPSLGASCADGSKAECTHLINQKLRPSSAPLLPELSNNPVASTKTAVTTTTGVSPKNWQHSPPTRPKRSSITRTRILWGKFILNQNGWPREDINSVYWVNYLL